jgi:hypothetical protein
LYRYTAAHCVRHNKMASTVDEAAAPAGHPSIINDSLPEEIKVGLYKVESRLSIA